MSKKGVLFCIIYIYLVRKLVNILQLAKLPIINAIKSTVTKINDLSTSLF